MVVNSEGYADCCESMFKGQAFDFDQKKVVYDVSPHWTFTNVYYLFLFWIFSLWNSTAKPNTKCSFFANQYLPRQLFGSYFSIIRLVVLMPIWVMFRSACRFQKLSRLLYFVIAKVHCSICCGMYLLRIESLAFSFNLFPSNLFQSLGSLFLVIF